MGSSTPKKAGEQGRADLNERGKKKLNGSSQCLMAKFKVRRSVGVPGPKRGSGKRRRKKRENRQYADSDFELLILLPGRNHNIDLGAHPLKHCMLVLPRSVLHSQGVMALPGHQPTRLSNCDITFLTNSHPFPGSELAAFTAVGKTLQGLVDHRWATDKPLTDKPEFLCIVVRIHTPVC